MKDWPKRPSGHRGMGKDPDRAIAPVLAHGPAHRALPGPPRPAAVPHSRLSHGARAAAGRGPCLSVRRAASGKSSSVRPRRLCGPPGFSVREGGLQASILERIDQSWLPSPSRTLYFLLPKPPTPLSMWCCLSPRNPSSGPTSTPGPHRGKPSPPGQPQGKPQWTSHMQRWK